MAATRVYVDTSVFGGVYDQTFQDASRTFFRLANAGVFSVVVSAVVRDEVYAAPENVRDVYRNVVADSDVLPVSEEALELSEAYLAAGVVSAKWEGDALHVALATVSRCVMIVSWNFKHIVNYR